MEFEKFQQLLAGILGVKPEKIKLEKSFVKDFGADSLMLFQIMMGVEASFGIVVPDEDMLRWDTVGQLWEYLEAGRKGL
jgi:acyl carrier protein